MSKTANPENFKQQKLKLLMPKKKIENPEKFKN